MSDRYPSNWGVIRKSVYSRDDYTCQICGVRGGKFGNSEVHAHHITPLSEGGSHNLSNLVTLCESCHSSQHNYDIGTNAGQENSNNQISEEDSNLIVDLAMIVGGIVTVPVAIISWIFNLSIDLAYVFFGSGLVVVFICVLIIGVSEADDNR